jgi:hypothetical protein
MTVTGLTKRVLLILQESANENLFRGVKEVGTSHGVGLFLYE